ncbi:uncharacterized protein BDR25DRAFT_330337 [Lindgomyces ingoldianus]|uniref:Uncharacterized protein n=1 Tax=Lindgomyces ingoldianus TaxID=673940 RepID=A0ACB6RH05_9PLEO|nr:uncharacterized protein BDR25DRAFT_330337 [Lindgomyces ingoldianus]KAF2477607.1 hypothetical protein BDR25DRAFT_330337 [Lindgomyces ingoldianus]
MAKDSCQYELVLLGATGYTGKLTAEYITTNLPTNLKWAIAGRNAKKLQNVAQELTKLAPDRKQPDIEICELQKDELDVLAKKTRLIVTTVGPYMWYGEPVLAACAENGTHYLDCTGETPWYRDMVDKYDGMAKRNGAIMIPQCGLDSVPADILTFFLTTHIRYTLHSPTSSVVLTLYALKSGLSGGTAATALNIFSHYPLKKLAADFKPWSISPMPPNQPSRPPKAANFFYRLLGLHYLPELGGIQTVGAMASVDTCLVHRSWGIFESLSNVAKDNTGSSSGSSSASSISYGPHFRFTEYMRAKTLSFAAIWRILFNLTGILLAFPPSRLLITPLAKKFLIPAPGEGPTKESMKNDFMHYRAVAIADSEGKEKVVGRLEVERGGYAMTALTLSVAAEVMLRGDLAATEAGKIGGGILTPATLGEQYVESLKKAGCKIEVGI